MSLVTIEPWTMPSDVTEAQLVQRLTYLRLELKKLRALYDEAFADEAKDITAEMRSLETSVQFMVVNRMSEAAMQGVFRQRPPDA